MIASSVAAAPIVSAEVRLDGVQRNRARSPAEHALEHFRLDPVVGRRPGSWVLTRSSSFPRSPRRRRGLSARPARALALADPAPSSWAPSAVLAWPRRCPRGSQPRPAGRRSARARPGRPPRRGPTAPPPVEGRQRLPRQRPEHVEATLDEAAERVRPQPGRRRPGRLLRRSAARPRLVAPDAQAVVTVRTGPRAPSASAPGTRVRTVVNRIGERPEAAAPGRGICRPGRSRPAPCRRPRRSARAPAGRPGARRSPAPRGPRRSGIAAAPAARQARGRTIHPEARAGESRWSFLTSPPRVTRGSPTGKPSISLMPETP